MAELPKGLSAVLWLLAVAAALAKKEEEGRRDDFPWAGAPSKFHSCRIFLPWPTTLSCSYSTSYLHGPVYVAYLYNILASGNFLSPPTSLGSSGRLLPANKTWRLPSLPHKNRLEFGKISWRQGIRMPFDGQALKKLAYSPPPKEPTRFLYSTASFMLMLELSPRRLPDSPLSPERPLFTPDRVTLK